VPTIDMLRGYFSWGYDSGDVLSPTPDPIRLKEERAIGGSYRQMFFEGFIKYCRPNARVLELGPGRGSWSRAILQCIPLGELHTVDFHDVRPWLQPELYGGRLHCHQVADNSLACVPDDYFDIFWSFGVLCHQNQAHIREIMTNALRKVRPGGVAVHEYGDWDKLDRLNWSAECGLAPETFRKIAEDETWWPHNNPVKMAHTCTEAGWQVVTADLGLFKRDSVIHLIKPARATKAA
jgi:SAM-dependent methyltransferase